MLETKYGRMKNNTNSSLTTLPLLLATITREHMDLEGYGPGTQSERALERNIEC